MKHDVFVSYRRSDREFVASVVRRLESRGIECWYDAEIEGGADWRETIVEALSESSMLVIFFSEDSNNSRQLKKELAVADSLGKPIVPVLIEDAQPRGAYLYELADRNWIKAFPDPPSKIPELVEHLAVLTGKSNGGLMGGGEPGARAPAPAAASAPAAAADKQLDRAVSEFIDGADGGERPAPTSTSAYIGRVGDEGRPVPKLNDVPPFRWIDLAVLVPGWIAIAAWRIMSTAGGPASELDRGTATIALLCLAFAGLYGSLVFPVRYFLRHRAVMDALMKYLGTSLMFLVAGAGIILSGMDKGYLQGADFLLYLRYAGLAWVVFTIIAFAVYGVLAGQRAIRSFRTNLRKI